MAIIIVVGTLTTDENTRANDYVLPLYEAYEFDIEFVGVGNNIYVVFETGHGTFKVPNSTWMYDRAVQESAIVTYDVDGKALFVEFHLLKTKNPNLIPTT
jgi:hypothetical protein